MYCAIDDSQIPKNGKDMEGLSKIRLHGEKNLLSSILFYCVYWFYRNAASPFDLRIWTSHETSKKLSNDNEKSEFTKLTNPAAERISSWKRLYSSNVTVLFDRNNLCAPALETIRAKGFDRVGDVKVVCRRRNRDKRSLTPSDK